MKRLVAPLALLALSGCGTFAAYDGARPDDAATIHADPRFNAGLPMTVSIRRVDEREVAMRYSRVRLAPGAHRLLVDCTLLETRATSRHVLEVEVEPGGQYRLVAESAPGNQRCGEVRLQAR
jgi:hypothetical protein